MRRALTGKDAKAAAELLPKTFSVIDRSAKIGIIKKNTAARYKSKLHLRVKALAAVRPVYFTHQLQNKLLHHDAVVRPRVAQSSVRLEDQLHRALQLRLA